MFAINDEIQPEVRLPQLKSLILRAVQYESITGYLDTFIVPALRSLQVPEQCLGANPIDVLASFISKSGCTLQELRITEEISVIKDLSEYRRAFPSIPKLSLKGWRMFDEASDEVSSVSDSDDLYVDLFISFTSN
jgi:hypothetical protein